MTADAHGSIGLSVVVSVKGSCALKPTAIATFDGPAKTFFVGFVPVVLSSVITVYLDANANAQAKVTSSISGSFNAHAGIGWRKSQGFYPIQTFTPTLSFTPPSLSASASVGADLTPTVDVLVYGVAGPQIALKAGLNLIADVNANPWWALTAPVDLTAKLAVPPLKLTSPTLHLYQRTFNLADAGGPFGGGAGGGGGGPATVTVTNPGSQTGTVGTPISLQIQASDTDGGALTYSATGLPASLSINPSSGLISGTPAAAQTTLVIGPSRRGSPP